MRLQKRKATELNKSIMRYERKIRITAIKGLKSLGFYVNNERD
jgi:hypothetical protein